MTMRGRRMLMTAISISAVQPMRIGQTASSPIIDQSLWNKMRTTCPTGTP